MSYLQNTVYFVGLSFTEVLAYIHHNPDRLEGLRLVDRRAVRNIYDTWKHPSRRSRQVQKDIDELSDTVDTPSMIKKKTTNKNDDDRDESIDNDEFVEKRDDESESEIDMNEMEKKPKLNIKTKMSPLSKTKPRMSGTVDDDNNDDDDDDGPPVLVPVEIKEKFQVNTVKETRSMRSNKMKPLSQQPSTSVATPDTPKSQGNNYLNL